MIRVTRGAGADVDSFQVLIGEQVSPSFASLVDLLRSLKVARSLVVA